MLEYEDDDDVTQWKETKHKRSVFSAAAARHFSCLLSEKKYLILMPSRGCVEKEGRN